MNSSTRKKATPFIHALGVVGALAVVAVVVSAVSKVIKPDDLTAQRRLERLQFRDEVFVATTGTLGSAAVVDAERGIYRIPLENAREIVLREWKNPADGRKALLERVDKATVKLADPFE